MKRCVIVGGADINNYDIAKGKLSGDDYIICCDRGLIHCKPLEITPDLIIGDFDSHEKPKTDIETIVLPREKDDTDTFYAAKEAVRRGFDDFLLLGVAGGRLDHSLGNISVLYMLESIGKSAVLIDDYSEMQIVSSANSPVFVSDDYECFSLLALGGKAAGITEKNVKYPLSDAEISPDYQYGISNEVLPGKTASVSVLSGKALLIKNYKN